MKKYFVLTISLFVLLGQFKLASEQIEVSKEFSLELNQENISLYEERIESHDFESPQAEEIYRNGYMGFLIWITNNEYPQYDTEYKNNLEE